MTYISVVSPVYKAENIVDELVARLILTLKTISDDFEIILVEDGSIDGSWKKIEQNCLKDSRVKGLKLSRNFGQHSAITAGLDITSGAWVVVLDCDLQDRPEEIFKMYLKAKEGYDIVFGRRMRRKDNFVKKTISLFFYKLFAYLTGIPQDQSIANYGIYSRKVIEAVCKIREPYRAFPTMINWVGFSKTSVDIEHGERIDKKSSYTWTKLINLALEIIIAYSNKPLMIVLKIGFFISTLSFFIALFYLIQYFSGNIKDIGFTSLMISVWFLFGLVIFILGIIGLYLSKAFEGIKNRPIYIVEKEVNNKI